jgi:hypothetical protein
MCGYLEQIGQGRDGPGRDHVELALDPFDLRLNHCGGQIERFANLVEKVRAEPPRLDERDGSVDEASDHNSRQPCTGADIDPRASGSRLEPHELSGIENVPLPDVLERPRGHQVLASILVAEKVNVLLELR